MTREHQFFRRSEKIIRRINFFDGAKKSRGAKRRGASIFSGRLSSAATTATVLFMFFGLISTRCCFTTTGGG